MSEYNRENHHDEHHDTIQSLAEERDSWKASALVNVGQLTKTMEERDALRVALLGECPHCRFTLSHDPTIARILNA